jgi:hypothetical protein
MSRSLFWGLNGGVNNNYILLTEETGVLTIDDVNVNNAETLYWGDGTSTPLVSGSNASLSHDYGGAIGEKLIIIGDRANLNSIKITTNVKNVNVRGCGIMGGINISNAGLEKIYFDNPQKVDVIYLPQNNLTSIDLSGINISTQIDVRENPLLSKILLPNDFGSTAFNIRGTSVGVIGLDHYGSAGSVSYQDCGMNQSDADQNINDLYSNKSAYEGHTPNLYIVGSGTYGTPNTQPSGTYDGTTDWSGGLPTSPMAKIYDLENNVTGTYNFNFTDIP